MKRTKIVCTIGPASETKAILRQMIKAGLNITRLNFSHGTYKHHTMLIRNIRAASKELNMPVGILQDLQGPRIRTGDVPEEGIKIRKGQTIVLAPEKYTGAGKLQVIPIQYAELYKDVKKGHPILIEDGTIQLKVTRIKDKAIYCKVRAGSLIKSHKGMNFPKSSISTPAITDKDKKDLVFGIKQNVDFVALSFVKDEQDVKRLRKLIDTEEKKNKRTVGATKIIAKIERPEAITNFEKILKEVDGIMIARGDLGLEVPIEQIPLIQKKIIRQCMEASKPVIVATQMLDSMIRNPVPTRAEVTDVANAILDGTDAIMLSGESATGKYPLQAVQTMQRIADQAEPVEIEEHEALEEHLRKTGGVTEVIALAAQNVAEDANAKAVVCLTDNGYLVRSVSKFRPEKYIVALAANEKLRNQLCLSWGVQPLIMKMTGGVEDLEKHVRKMLSQYKVAKKGETVVVVGGHPLEMDTPSNLIKVITV